MPAGRLVVRGLRELDHALSKGNKTLRNELRGRLKDIAEQAASHARTLVNRKGLVDSGDLERGIRAYASSGRAGVRSNAVHRGYDYPRRLEFEGRQEGGYGPRATLNPAVDEVRPELERGTEELLEHIEHDFTTGA